MKEILKKTRLNILIASALTIVLGLIFVFNPVDATVFICRAAGFILLIIGMFMTGSYFLNLSDNVGNSSLIAGLIEFALGIWITLKPEHFVQFLTVIAGFILLVHGFSLIQGAIEIKRLSYKYWWVELMIALITTALGIIIIVSPFATVAVAMVVTGVCLILDGISTLLITLKISKVLKKISDEVGMIETTGEEIK